MEKDRGKEQKPLIDAISAIFINLQGQVLLLHRHEERTHGKNQWDLMGGNIGPGETPFNTLVRDA